MINSFEIKNYRNLNGLKIEKLAKVNLITGKNNSGKTNLLQALELFTSNFNHEILIKHYISKKEINSENLDNFNNDIICKSFLNIFDRKYLNLNNTDENLNKSIKLSSDKNEFELKFIDINDIIEIQDNYLKVKVYAFQINNNKDLVIGFNHTIKQIKESSYLENKNYIKNNINYISSNPLENKNNSELWDNISLSDYENDVIKALNIISPNVKNISFKGDQRIPYIRIEENDKTYILHLQSMGDGINRILTIILGLINSKDGYFFIDEIENGLHYSVQEQLWEMIFLLSEKLNIQVFVTTHSDDSIKSFSEVWNRNYNKNKGSYFRINHTKNKIITTNYDNELLKSLSDDNYNSIEAR